MFNWFAAANAHRFGKELATSILSELNVSARKGDAKFSARAEKVLVRAAHRLRDFKSKEKMNIYKKSRLANAFMWTLKDGGCDDEYLRELTDWLTLCL